MPNPKVKDMPRKQQMAVKATMADGGKGNPNKMKKSSALKKINMKETVCKIIKKITFGKVCLKWCKTCDIK